MVASSPRSPAMDTNGINDIRIAPITNLKFDIALFIAHTFLSRSYNPFILM